MNKGVFDREGEGLCRQAKHEVGASYLMPSVGEKVRFASPIR